MVVDEIIFTEMNGKKFLASVLMIPVILVVVYFMLLILLGMVGMLKKVGPDNFNAITVVISGIIYVFVLIQIWNKNTTVN